MTHSDPMPAPPVRRLLAAARRLATGTDATQVAQRAAALALVIRVGSAGLAYAAQVVLARLMGQFEYGVFAYTWVWFLVFSAVATLGFGDSPLRYIAQLRARGEAAHVRGFLRLGTLVTVAASLAFAGLILAVLPLAGRWIGTAYLTPMALMAVAIPFACVQAFLEAIGRCYGWSLPALLPVYIFRHGFLLAFMAAAVAWGFEANAVTGFACVVLTLLVSLLYQATSILTRLRGVLEPAAPAYRPREWMRGSLPFAAIYALQHLASFADVLVLSFFVSPQEIAIYFAATRIIQVVNLVPYAATFGTAHLFSASHARGDLAEMQRICRHACLVTAAVASAAVGLILVAGHALLAMFGAGFEAGYAPLAILAIGVLARVAAGPAEDVLNMTGHSGLSASTYLVTVVANAALAAALVPTFGIEGAAFATSLALAARSIWLSAALRWRLGIRPSILAALLPQAPAERPAPAE